MGYSYTTIDGHRVETTVAAKFREMAAEFQRVWGLSLHVESGTRTRAEQQRLYDGWLKRLPGFNLAAPPGQSFHEESGPQGPRALDLRDSGNDAGVRTVGTRRNNWIRDNASRWGFTLSGLTFSPKEGWHVHFTGVLGGGGSAPAGQWPARTRYGHDWTVAAQKKLAAMGLYGGELDGKDGPDTQSGTKVLQGVLGLEQDGIYGPQTNTGADVILGGGNWSNRPVADIQRVVGVDPDNEWGGKTSLGVYKWQKANGLTADAQWGPSSDAKGFPGVVVPPVTTPPVGQVATPRVPTYSPAVRAWSLPWALPRTQKVLGIFLHHQAGTGDDEGYFKTKNERSSWPTWQQKASGEVVEFSNPQTQLPSSTQGHNGEWLSIETQNSSGAPLWAISDPAHESIAHIVAWAAKEYGFPIDAAHVRKHSEVYATACPGPSMDVARIIKRAIEINTPTPPAPDTVAVDRSWLQGLLDAVKGLLGGSK